MLTLLPEGLPWYLHFPRGYWLYEKSKHLWVSGYPIKGKLFKTPQEFGLHLMWLMSTSMDYRDCCCIHCNVPPVPKPASAPEMQVAAPSVVAPSKPPQAMPHKVTPVPLPVFPGQPKLKQAANGTAAEQPQQRSVSAANSIAAPAGQPQPAASQGQAAGQAQPQPQPQPQAPTQTPVPAPVHTPVQAPPQEPAHAQVQSQPQPPPPAQTQVPAQPRLPQWSLQASLLFRAGELVWYQNGNSWRLGVVSAPGTERFEVIPIGHEAAVPQLVEKLKNEMRPFHAFSVPSVALAELQGKLFDAAPWVELFNYAGQDRVKRNNLLLDASKMAASKIDASYSVWGPLAQGIKAEAVCFYGCFLGAERIELGDCLRVAPVTSESVSWNESSVLGLRRIFMRTNNRQRSIILAGTIYQIPKADDGFAKAVPIQDLPIPLQEESRWRNAASLGQSWRWVLVKEDVMLEERSIRGRFYPTHHIMPVLNEAAFKAAVAERNVDSQYPYLNNRLDGSGGYIGFCYNRRETLGASVPAGAKLRMEPAVREMERVSG